MVALSHAHEDHIGGLAALVSDFRPRELWTGATPESGPGARRGGARRRRERSVRPLTGPVRFAYGGAEIEVLAPAADYTPGAVPKNNDSLVFMVHYGRHSFLFAGDIERQVERMLHPGRADVLKVAHHGSRTSSTEEFLDAVSPAFAIISAGLDNSYGHPNPDVLERLERHRAVVLRTDMDGMITVRSDGRRLLVRTQNGFLRGFEGEPFSALLALSPYVFSIAYGRFSAISAKSDRKGPLSDISRTGPLTTNCQHEHVTDL